MMLSRPQKWDRLTQHAIYSSPLAKIGDEQTDKGSLMYGMSGLLT